MSLFHRSTVWPGARWVRLGLGLFLMVAAIESPGAELMSIPARWRERVPADTNQWRVVERNLTWDPQRTAVVVCDMWDRHWCEGATGRVGEMAPRMNEVLEAARAKGMLIIHCPSDTLKFYEGTPQRRLAQEAPKAPNRPKGWRSLDASREPALPIDDSDGGCDEHPACRQHSAWKRQVATLEIRPGDAITDSDEAYNLMMQRGITNVVVMGVHLNMCVLGRPFSIRNMVLQGQNVLLVRDLTDTMYNSRMAPFVSHFAGTDLVTEHVEKYWCPSTTSVAFLGGEPFRFRADRRPRVVILIGEDEYRTWETLPEFAEHDLGWRGYDVQVIQQDPANKHRFPELVVALRDADLLVVSLRRRALGREELTAVRAHLEAGRAVVGLRTASHGFAPRAEDADQGEAWPAFDLEVLGGNYRGHHGNGLKVGLRVAPGAETHPILTGVNLTSFVSEGSLYRVSPLAAGTTPLVIGSVGDQPAEPVAWTHLAGAKSARVFYTSLGHPTDFGQPAFRRLLLNGILWAMGEPIPPEVRATVAREPSGNGGVVERPEPAEKSAATVPPLAPEESARRFTVVDGLEMELLLSEPVIAQPLQISFDERGRLWLVEYRQYPSPAGLKLVSHDQFWCAV